jgi:hypothetical protein
MIMYWYWYFVIIANVGIVFGQHMKGAALLNQSLIYFF